MTDVDLTDVALTDLGLSEDRFDWKMDLRRCVVDDAVDVDFVDAASAFDALPVEVAVVFEEDITAEEQNLSCVGNILSGEGTKDS